MSYLLSTLTFLRYHRGMNANSRDFPTTDYRPESIPLAATLPVQKNNSRIKLVEGAAPDEANEFEELLQRRFTKASVVFLIAYAGFFIRDLIFYHRVGVEFERYLLALGVAIQSGVTLALLTGYATGKTRRKFAQYLTIALAWAILTGLQFDVFRYEIHQPEAIASDWAPSFQIVVANTNFFPWFVVLAGYPVLVPMAWQRAVVFGVGMMCIPSLITIIAANTMPPLDWSRTAYMYGQYFVWGTIGTCIAAYGSAQAGALRKEVFEARRFGQYILRDKLGGGGMGDVYLAEHRLLKRPSVIKVIRPDRSSHPNMLARFEREVKILATLTHWNTVEVYDYGHTPEGTFYFVMEFLPGSDLHDLVKSHGPMPPARVVFLIAQVCAGLREAHAGGLIHRDIKPGNIMATERGGLRDVAKLLDFGLVFEPGSLTDSGKLTHETAILGTPQYMSPEQARGEPVDSRSDIYALGATMYFLLTGRPPFNQKAVVEVLAAHLSTPPVSLRELNPEVPVDLEEVILKCLAKKTEDRYQSVRELELALRACACATAWSHECAAELSR